MLSEPAFLAITLPFKIKSDVCQKEGAYSSTEEEETHLKGNFDKVFLDEDQKVFELDSEGFRYWGVRGNSIPYRRTW